jgi:peptidoglycan/xylan/chitin deacetylase (PgdA/CDA1 family)
MSLNLWERAQGRYIRSAAGSFFRRPLVVQAQEPLISFTFDDFPRSALHAGGAILKSFGLRGTYYVSLGLLGKQEPTGSICLPEDLKRLREQGHELGCHTFGHFDSWQTRTSVFVDSVIRNREALADLFPGDRFRSFSYPINPPRIRTKREIAQHFVCSRGGGQTTNTGTTDSNYLAAYFLEKSKGNPTPVKEVIDLNRRSRGWLIFATHDVDTSPTPYGCTPEFFSEVVEYAARSGARVLPVIEAFEVLTRPAKPASTCS